MDHGLPLSPMAGTAKLLGPVVLTDDTTDMEIWLMKDEKDLQEKIDYLQDVLPGKFYIEEDDLAIKVVYPK